MSIIKLLASNWNVGRDFQCIDNSKLREEARQQRREQARLQQPTEKQPTRNLFGPPIPVSRPNDPTFEQLSNFFGSPVGADISCFRSSSNNDCSPTDRSSQGHRPSVMRHGDVRDAAVEHSNSRRAEHRQNESRHGGDTRQGDARQGDARQGDTRHGDVKHRDGRNGETAVRGSRPGRGVAATTPSLDVEPSRQGVFEQFKSSSSSSKTPATVESDGLATKTSGARQPVTHGKTKHRTSSKSEELSSGGRLTGFKPESQSKQQPAANQSKCSSDGAPDPSRNVSPPLLSGRMNGVRKEMNGSPSDHRTTSGKGNEKLAGVRVNGIHQGADLNGKSSDVEKKLRLHISKEYEKCDDLVTKVLQAVSIRSPLTGILTPKKTDFPFSFPNTIEQFNETIPEGFLSSDEDDGKEIVMVDHGPVQRPERLCDYAGKTIPNQSSNVLHDLNISDSSDSETEQVEEISEAQRTPGGAGQRSATDPKLSGAVPSTGNAKNRHLSESSEASSTEGSGTSGSESDTSQSDNEDDGAVKQTGGAVKDEDDEAEAKQSKRTSWEIENFIPKNKQQVPFILSSSSSPPSPPFAGVNRQTSNAGFDIDINDPIKEMYMMSPRQVPSPIVTSDVERPESCHSGDVVCHPSSPKIPPSPRVALNGLRPPVASPADLYRADAFSGSARDPKSRTHSRSPKHGASFLAPISGVEYRVGNPSVIVRIRRSYLLKKENGKNAKLRDSASNGTCGTTDTAHVSTLVPSRSATPRSQAQTGRGPDVSWYSPESAVKSDRPLDASVPRNSHSHSRVPESTPERTSIAQAPSAFELASTARKDSRIEGSPAKCSQDKTATDVAYPISSKATKRKSDDVGRPDSKKICDRRKEDRKSQPSQLQNGNPDNSQKLSAVAPNFKIESKSPMTNGEDNNSRSSSSSSSSNVQKRTERTKTQNGRSRPDDKTRKSSSSKVNGKVSDSEAPNSVSNRGAKGTTPVVNGIGESPSDPNPDICGENGLSVSGDIDDVGKRSRDHDGNVDRLTTFGPKNSLNGIKRFKFEPEKLESSDYYMRNARKLKHEGDSRPDKYFKVLNYTESVLAFLCHCSALEAEHAEFARIQKMYQDTLALCQYVVRVMESVIGPEKYHLIAINLRIQAIISLRLYSIRKADVAKLKSVLDEHNKSHMSKPLQIPSPYQTNHHHPANNTAAAAAAVSWNHANGTPSPRSPRPSPSPAGSIGSVGSAGSSNGDNMGMAKPLSVVNGHGLTSIVVPQRIHSVMMNFVNYMNYLHQCLEFWDQAEAILVTHPAVGDFFHSVDREFGPIDLHSPALAIVRYASEVVTHVRSEVKRTSQVVRTD